MTVKERIKKAINTPRPEGNNLKGQMTTLDEIIAQAYWMGKEQGVKEVSDQATMIWKGQLERAKSCRYYKMATEIVGYGNPWSGNDGFTYHPDYRGDMTEEFGDDKWLGD